jgi:1,4-alpha-glucan branching enzyme
MPRKKVKTGSKPKRRRTLFHLEAPEASEVYLVGDFNNWDKQKHPMKREENGIWKKITVLLPGRYEYKFLVDGRWQNDTGSSQLCRNRYGTQNNVIEVRPG